MLHSVACMRWAGWVAVSLIAPYEGTLAEALCSELGIPGAAFNAPQSHWYVRGTAHMGVPFEVHLTEGDGRGNKWGNKGEKDHIAKAHWHGPAPEGINESSNGHLMRDMIRLMKWRLPHPADNAPGFMSSGPFAPSGSIGAQAK